MKPTRIAAAVVAVLALMLGVVAGNWPPWPTGAQTTSLGPITQTFTTSGSAPIKFGPLKGQNSCTFQSTSAGPTDATVSNDGASWSATVITSMAGAVEAQPFTPTTGVTYQIAPTTAVYIQISPDTTWSGQTATVTAYCSGALAALPGGTGAPGPSGPPGSPGAGANLVAGTCITVVPTASPPSGQIINVNGSGCTPPPFPLSIANGGTGTAAPAPTGTNGCTVGTFPSLVVSCPGTAETFTASAPVVVSTAVANTVNYACANCLQYTAGGTGLVLTTGPAPSLSPPPQAGYAQVIGGFYVGPVGATPSPNPLDYQMSSTNCTTSSMGSTATLKYGISGDLAAFYCGGVLSAFINQNGVLGAGGFVTPGNLELYENSSTGGNCFLGPGINGWLITSSAGTCPLTLQSTAVQNKGQLTCTLSSLTCTQTQTVLTGMTCVAAYDTAATTVTAALLLPLTVKVVSSTLTISMQGAATATGTAAADYLCF